MRDVACLRRRLTSNVGASFRARDQAIPKDNALEDIQRDWWRALKDPPTSTADSRGGATRD
jgi:hypothetical protein